MKHRDDFLAYLDRLEYNTFMPGRADLVDNMKRILDSLSLSLNYKKLKLMSVIDHDFVKDDGLLFEFFGSDDIREQEKKLDELVKKLEKVRSLH